MAAMASKEGAEGSIVFKDESSTLRVNQGVTDNSLADPVVPLPADPEAISPTPTGGEQEAALEDIQAQAGDKPCPEPGAAQEQDAFLLKRVKWGGRTLQILTQNENGPCPLVALCNVLLLRNDISLSSEAELVPAEYLLSLVVELLIRRSSKACKYRKWFCQWHRGWSAGSLRS